MRSAVLGCCMIAVTMIAGCAAPTTRPVTVSAAATDAEALKQTELVVQDLVDKQKRVSRVYRLLSTRAHAMCGEHVGPDTGIFALVRPQGPYGAVLASNYGIREQLTILFVLEGSPADVAGLKAGDVISKVNGAPVAQAKSVEELHEKLPPEGPIVYEIERSGTLLSFSAQPDRACGDRVRVVPSQAVNALADGKRIIVTRGMANFAADDAELALVIAHEMAHNSMRHLEAKKQNASAGLLADLAIILLSRGQVSSPNLAQAGAMAYSQEFESEADYVGLYIMVNAGLPIDDAPLFWRRMAAAHPGSIRSNHAASHPSTAQRMVALEGTVREIDAKRVANAPLRPNLKDGQVAPSTAATASAAPGRAAASASAATAGGLPAAGTSWTYAIADRMYGKPTARLTVIATSAAHQIVDERLSVSASAGSTTLPRAIDVRSARFVELPMGAGSTLVEFAPYFLAAFGEQGVALDSGSAGYPAGRGNTGWIVGMTRPPIWELVEVPAGTFRALRLEFDGRRERPVIANSARFSMRVWYSPEVNRYVRLESAEWETYTDRQTSDMVVELVRFTPPS